MVLGCCLNTEPDVEGRREASGRHQRSEEREENDEKGEKEGRTAEGRGSWAEDPQDGANHVLDDRHWSWFYLRVSA